MYIASEGCARENRNRTAATTPARLNASARLLRTIIAMPETTTGRIMMVCRNDWSIRRARLVMKYTQETGTVRTIAPTQASARRTGACRANTVSLTLEYTGSNESVLISSRKSTPPIGKNSRNIG